MSDREGGIQQKKSPNFVTASVENFSKARKNKKFKWLSIYLHIIALASPLIFDVSVSVILLYKLYKSFKDFFWGVVFYNFVRQFFSPLFCCKSRSIKTG
jgi:hypothetical protein